MSAIHILKNTNTQTVLKVYRDTAGTETITLASLALASEEISGTPLVNIRAIMFGMKPNSHIVVQRDAAGTPEGEIYLTSAGFFDFAGNGYSDNTYNDRNIQVVFSNEGTIIIDLAKVKGYKTRLQPAEFSVYDNPNSTTA